MFQQYSLTVSLLIRLLSLRVGGRRPCGIKGRPGKRPSKTTSAAVVSCFSRHRKQLDFIRTGLHSICFCKLFNLPFRVEGIFFCLYLDSTSLRYFSNFTSESVKGPFVDLVLWVPFFTMASVQTPLGRRWEKGVHGRRKVNSCRYI